MNLYVFMAVGVLFAGFGLYSIIRRRFSIRRHTRRRRRGRGCLPLVFTLTGWPAVIAGAGLLIAGGLWSIPPAYALLVHGSASPESVPFGLGIGVLIGGVLAGVVFQIVRGVGQKVRDI